MENGPSKLLTVIKNEQDLPLCQRKISRGFTYDLDAPCMEYLHLVDSVNVGKYSSTMEHLGEN